MVGTYRAAGRLVWSHRWAFLALVVLFAGADLLPGIRDSSGATLFVPYLIAVMAMHRALLLGEGLWRLGGGRATLAPVARFVGVSMLLWGLVIAAGAASMLALMALLPPLEGRRGQVALGVGIMGAIPAALVVFSVWGTALPAAALGERRVLRAALGRARRTGWRVAGGLVAGPAAWTAAAFGAWLAVAPRLGLGGEAVVDGRIRWEVALASVIPQGIGLFGSALTVAVLCGAYARAGRPPALPPGGELRASGQIPA